MIYSLTGKIIKKTLNAVVICCGGVGYYAQCPASVAEARGVILLAAAQAGLPIYEYTPMQVKQAVTGYGKAVKKQVQEMTRILLHLPAIPKPDDTADALAMAITFCHTNGSQLNRFVRRVPGPI